MAIEIHREPLYRRYYSSVFSWAFLYIFIVWFLIIFLPLIIAYNSSGFWLKETIIYTQPNIKYRYECIVETYGQNLLNKAPISLFYSTSNSINQLHSNLRFAKLSSVEIDENDDGIVDRLELNIQSPISKYEAVTGFSSIVYHEVETLSYLFDAMSYIRYDSAQPISAVYIEGNLMIQQAWLFDSNGGFKKPYSSDLLDTSDQISQSELSISSIMKTDFARNYTLQYNANFAYSDVSPISNNLTTDNFPYIFNVSIAMKIPYQPVRYSPPTSEVLKNAWIQYVSYLIVITFLFIRINSYVFRHQLIAVYATADIVMGKLD